jgi:putative Mn2+ efflux pump MntP
MLRLLLFVLPLGLDTLGVSISLGIRSVECGDPAWGAGNIQHVQPHDKSGIYRSVGAPAKLAERFSIPCPPPQRSEAERVSILRPSGIAFPAWLGSALLFSLAETVMPLVGLTIGFAVSLFLSNVMHILGPLLLIGVGLWELLQEVRERTNKHKKHQCSGAPCGYQEPPARSILWGRQLLLALSISLDELAIGFSLGAITSGTLSGGQVMPESKTIYTITLCILIGLQGFLMTLIGLTLGRTLRVRLKSVKQWTELLSCFLLIALGVWLLIT